MEGGAIQGGVDAEDWHLGVLELEDPAGPEAAEGGVHDEGGVAEAGEEGAAVEVKGEVKGQGDSALVRRKVQIGGCLVG